MVFNSMETTFGPLGILEKIAVGALGALGVPQLEPLVVVDSLAVHRPQPGYPPATAWLSTSHSLRLCGSLCPTDFSSLVLIVQLVS